MAKKKSTVSPSSPRPSERERGMAAFRRGDYQGAILAWTPLLRRETEQGGLRRALAEAHFRRACTNPRAESALEDLKSANEMIPGDPIYLYHLGVCYHRRGELKEALKAYRESIRLDPQHYARTAYLLCLAVAESGGDPRYEDTWDLLTPEQQAKIRPTFAPLLEAVKRLLMGDFEGAESPLRESLNRSIPFGQYYLGVIAWRRGQRREAISRWLAARTAGVNSPWVRQNLLRALTERAIASPEDPEVMSESVRMALKLAPDSPVLLKLKQRADFLEGNAAAESGDWDTALRCWNAARKGGGAPRELIANIALAHERLEQWGDAAETWREFLRRRPRRSDSRDFMWSPQHTARLWRHIDSLYARDGQFAQAAISLRYAIKAQPDDLALRVGLIKRYLENQNHKAALTAALRVLEIAPRHAEALTLYAQAVEMEGDYDRSIEAWERLDRSPNSAFGALATGRLVALYAGRADLHLANQDYPTAAADFAKALEITPEDNLLRARYGAVLARYQPRHAKAEFAKVNLEDDSAALLMIGSWHAAGDHNTARSLLEKRRKRKPFPPERIVELGVSLIGTRREIAGEYFNAALESAPSETRPALLTRIAVAYSDHDLTVAYDYARRALKLDPNYGAAHLHLGLWDASKGRRAAALDHLQKAVDWARRLKRRSLREGIEEALNLLLERYTPTFEEVLESIDPEGTDVDNRRLLGAG